MICNHALEELNKNNSALVILHIFYPIICENYLQNGYFSQKIVNINGDAVEI